MTGCNSTPPLGDRLCLSRKDHHRSFGTEAKALGKRLVSALYAFYQDTKLSSEQIIRLSTFEAGAA